MDKYQYLKDLKKRQKQHLKNVKKYLNQNDSWSPCAHDSCTSCHGTGIRYDGSACIHNLYCSCTKCSPSYSIPTIVWTGTSTELSVTTSDPSFKIDGTTGYLTYTATNTGLSEEINT